MAAMAQTTTPSDLPSIHAEPPHDTPVTTFSPFEVRSSTPTLPFGARSSTPTTLPFEVRSSTPTILRPRPISPSEARAVTPTLSPSPAFLEPSRSSKDNGSSKGPETPKRSGLGLRGMSLQLAMPTKESSGDASAASPSAQRVPQSPKLDTSPAFASPGSVLPRRSRGMDYTRACTNLHHSTIADQSSPDSSPVIGGRGLNVPRRMHGLSGPDSPMFASSTWATSGGQDGRAMFSSSIGSVNMLGSGSDSDSSDDDMAGDEDDTIHHTPQPFKSHTANAFGITGHASSNVDTMSPFAQAAASLMSFQRRTRKARSSTRHSSSSASGRSSMPSPAPGSPPLLKSIEQSAGMGYFDKEHKPKSMESRRESLSLGTGDLHISDGADEDSGEHSSLSDALGLSMHGQASADGRRNVIKRAVTRRSNMLPKTKTFARIRAALQEETSPVDAESKREAEVIRQVRESDHGHDTVAVASQPPTTVSSPSLLPQGSSNNSEGLEDLTEMMAGEVTINSRRGSSNVARPPLFRSAGGSEFWKEGETRMRTPPPPFFGRSSSSGVSEDVSMETPASSIYSVNHTRHSSPSRSTTPQPAPAEAARKALGKRRRDDDLDPYLFKRRAVSPGVSHQNSPVLPPSPAQREGTFWSTRSGEGHRSGSNGSQGVSGSVAKMVGFKGMNDTNDGLMNMTIE